MTQKEKIFVHIDCGLDMQVKWFFCIVSTIGAMIAEWKARPKTHTKQLLIGKNVSQVQWQHMCDENPENVSLILSFISIEFQWQDIVKWKKKIIRHNSKSQDYLNVFRCIRFFYSSY